MFNSNVTLVDGKFYDANGVRCKCINGELFTWSGGRITAYAVIAEATSPPPPSDSQLMQLCDVPDWSEVICHQINFDPHFKWIPVGTVFGGKFYPKLQADQHLADKGMVQVIGTTNGEKYKIPEEFTNNVFVPYVTLCHLRPITRAWSERPIMNDTIAISTTPLITYHQVGDIPLLLASFEKSDTRTDDGQTLYICQKVTHVGFLNESDKLQFQLTNS